MKCGLVLLVIVQVIQICKSENEHLQKHDVKKRSILVINNNPPARHSSIQSNSNNVGRTSVDNNFMSTLKKVLLETLKSLSQFNGQLARYFVQHHPSLTNLYNQMTKNSDTAPKTSTVRPIVLRTTELLSTTTPSTPAQSKRISVGLSEFKRNPPKKENEESMKVKNITAGSITATKVTSKVVRANNIVADNVIVTANGKKNTFQYKKNYNTQNEKRVQPVSFSFRNFGYGKNLFGNRNNDNSFGLSSQTPRTNRNDDSSFGLSSQTSRTNRNDDNSFGLSSQTSRTNRNDDNSFGLSSQASRTNRNDDNSFGLSSQTVRTHRQSFVDSSDRSSLSKHFVDRRKYFPPRKVENHRRNNNSGTRIKTSSPHLQFQSTQRANIQKQRARPILNFQRQQASILNKHRSIQNRNPISQFSFSIPQKPLVPKQTWSSKYTQTQKKQKSSWYDSWSDFDDSDDEYYDDEYDRSFDAIRQSSTISGSDINAGAIIAKTMFADSVRASQISVRKVIAGDVVVSARYGK